MSKFPAGNGGIEVSQKETKSSFVSTGKKSVNTPLVPSSTVPTRGSVKS